MDDKARAQTVDRQNTKRARLCRSIARKVTNNAETYIELNGDLDGFDVHHKICEILDGYDLLRDRWDNGGWDWTRMENDVRRLTALYMDK